MLEITDFQKIFPKCKDYFTFATALNKHFPYYQINTENRIMFFLAQTGVESAYYTRFKESTYYSNPAWIETVFRSHRRHGYSGEQLKKNPKLLGSVVYAGINGNGDIESGDGYLYRGRGLLQVTGKANYQEVKEDLGVDVIANPDLLCNDIDLCVRSALNFWEKRNLNELCDEDKFKTLTKRINGGYNHLKERRKLLAKIKEIFNK